MIAIYRQLAAGIGLVVSAIVVFRLVDAYIAVFRLFTDLITKLSCLQTQTATPVSLSNV